ncbi:hypothetical protein PQE12_gp48 [Arthrobacter phage Adumb2043]|uniref:Terminase small subunit n=1 Tax=Arthrobacter phage Adumb2043 TaxID=2776851 RepID=A0A7M1CML1_9CAUD|nr:hypothetical protein PQE12_gp48 [Arthrobacter phage Adumb2043]QOP65108.1 hypothetical protein SEA_ADUMB2043_48 [Arthrobacter phage Adumb2043]
MATPSEHRSKAEELLALGRTYPHNSAARLATFAEAQVEALLALGSEDAFGTPAVAEIDAQLTAPVDAKPARRTRKAASAKEVAE